MRSLIAKLLQKLYQSSRSTLWMHEEPELTVKSMACYNLHQLVVASIAYISWLKIFAGHIYMKGNEIKGEKC